MGQAALAGDGLHYWNTAFHREIGHRRFRQRIAHTTSRDDERLLCCLQERCCLGETPPVGARTRDDPEPRLEERLGVIEGNLLRVLRQGEEGRATVSRVEHRGDSLG